MAENDDSGGGGENTQETKTDINPQEAHNACNGKSGPIEHNTASNDEEEATADTATTGTVNGRATASAEKHGHIASPSNGGVKHCDEDASHNCGEKTASSIIASPPSQSPVVVRLRSKNPSPATASANGSIDKPAGSRLVKGTRMQLRDYEEMAANGNNQAESSSNDSSLNGTAAILQRTMESLYEAPPEMEDNTEEIRKLDSQLDHLSEYMGKVEERLKVHNEKLMETLKQQKEEREKRRRSFHERLDANRQEDDDFQRQLSQILNRVDLSRKRQSAYDLVLPTNGDAEQLVTPDNQNSTAESSSSGKP